MNNLQSPCSPTRRRKTSSSNMSSPRHSNISKDVVSPNDRFIPSRRAINFDVSTFYLNDLENKNDQEGRNTSQIQSPTSPSSTQPQSHIKETEFEYQLRNALLESPNSHSSNYSLENSPNSSRYDHSNNQQGLSPRVLNYSNCGDVATKELPLFDMLNNHKTSDYSISRKRNSDGNGSYSNRIIQSAPSRILDAPDIVDDYYLNLISWSSSNVLAVALGPSIYTWNAEKNR